MGERTVGIFDRGGRFFECNASDAGRERTRLERKFYPRAFVPETVADGAADFRDAIDAALDAREALLDDRRAKARERMADPATHRYGVAEYDPYAILFGKPDWSVSHTTATKAEARSMLRIVLAHKKPADRWMAKIVPLPFDPDARPGAARS